LVENYKFSNMVPFNKILCPYDFSEYSKHALAWTLKLNESNNLSIYILHIMINPLLYETGSPVFGNQIYADDLLSKLREENQVQLDELMAQLQIDHPEMELHLICKESNDIGACIIESQQELTSDLIVMGSHGRKGIKRFVLGSVAEDVVRHANCPVLVVR